MKTANDFITEYDLHLLAEGTHYRSWEKLGAHIIREKEEEGTFFALWAPNAKKVSVIGDFNHWNDSANPLKRIKDSGYWRGFVPGVINGALYKYAITSRYNNSKNKRHGGDDGAFPLPTSGQS